MFADHGVLLGEGVGAWTSAPLSSPPDAVEGGEIMFHNPVAACWGRSSCVVVASYLVRGGTALKAVTRTDGG